MPDAPGTDESGRRFLTALQLADSFFPSGMYAHSHGLESMVARRWVSDADGVAKYLHNLLRWSIMPADGVALRNAHAAARDADLDAIAEIDRHLYAMKLPEELRQASCHAGRRILDEATAFLSCNSPPGDGKEKAAAAPVCAGFRRRVTNRETPGCGAVALGVVAQSQSIAAETALLMMCHSFAVGVLGAAQRLLPLTHSQAQSILYSLNAPVANAAAALQSRHWREMTSFTPQADIAAMLHQRDEVRMFAS